MKELNAEIKALSFAKGKRDTARLKELKEEVAKTANRINIYDSQLLRLEVTKSQKDVLPREKEKVIKKQKAKDKGVNFSFINNQKLKESGFAIEGKEVAGYLSVNRVAVNICCYFLRGNKKDRGL